MNNFVPNKKFLHGILLHYYHLMKSASESNYILINVYGDRALDVRLCEKWFIQFKSGNFDFEDKEEAGTSKNFGNEEMQLSCLCNECSSQRMLGVIRRKITHRSNGKRFILMRGHYVSIPIPPPKKLFLRQVLLHYFNMKKTASETHRILQKVYGDDDVPAELTCRKWFQKFKSGNFELKDKDQIGAPKKFKDEELHALLVEDSMQTQEELAKRLGATQRAISHRLKAMGINRKIIKGNRRET